MALATVPKYRKLEPQNKHDMICIDNRRTFGDTLKTPNYDIDGFIKQLLNSEKFNELAEIVAEKAAQKLISIDRPISLIESYTLNKSLSNTLSSNVLAKPGQVLLPRNNNAIENISDYKENNYTNRAIVGDKNSGNVGIQNNAKIVTLKPNLLVDRVYGSDPLNNQEVEDNPAHNMPNTYTYVNKRPQEIKMDGVSTNSHEHKLVLYTEDEHGNRKEVIEELRERAFRSNDDGYGADNKNKNNDFSKQTNLDIKTNTEKHINFNSNTHYDNSKNNVSKSFHINSNKQKNKRIERNTNTEKNNSLVINSVTERHTNFFAKKKQKNKQNDSFLRGKEPDLNIFFNLHPTTELVDARSQPINQTEQQSKETQRKDDSKDEDSKQVQTTKELPLFSGLDENDSRKSLEDDSKTTNTPLHKSKAVKQNVKTYLTTKSNVKKSKTKPNARTDDKNSNIEYDSSDYEQDTPNKKVNRNSVNKEFDKEYLTTTSRITWKEGDQLFAFQSGPEYDDYHVQLNKQFINMYNAYDYKK